jgi:hypothetical protein
MNSIRMFMWDRSREATVLERIQKSPFHLICDLDFAQNFERIFLSAFVTNKANGWLNRPERLSASMGQLPELDLILSGP